MPSLLVCPVCARLHQGGAVICPEDGAFLEAPKDPRTGLQVGSYLLMGPLGKGGMGVVYRGEHVIIGKPVAIKVLRRSLMREESVVQRFLLEARAASMIRHPNIVDVTDFGRLPDGCSFFVMEFLEGPSLEQVIEKEGALPLYRTVNVLGQVCSALHACHAKGIVHRDLKPENIVLLLRAGQRDLVFLPADPTVDPRIQPEETYDAVKVLDFGVALIAELTGKLEREAVSRGIVVGSPYYISPEQAQGKPGDARSDVYSLGVILFEMLTGDVPFGGDSALEILASHVQSPIPSAIAARPDLAFPPEVDEVVRRALAKRPEERYPGVAAFLGDLRNCFGKVIYGRDLGRYLEHERRKATGVHARPTAPAPAAPPSPVHTDLEELFRGKYEAPRPVTQREVSAVAPRSPENPDRAAVEEELRGLFDPEDR